MYERRNYITDIQTNIDFIEGKLTELNTELNNASRFDSSPGHLAYVAQLHRKHELFLNSLETWKCIRNVYPNYNR